MTARAADKFQSTFKEQKKALMEVSAFFVSKICDLGD